MYTCNTLAYFSYCCITDLLIIIMTTYYHYYFMSGMYCCRLWSTTHRLLLSLFVYLYFECIVDQYSVYVLLSCRAYAWAR